jgi:hypothetical protein
LHDFFIVFAMYQCAPPFLRRCSRAVGGGMQNIIVEALSRAAILNAYPLVHLAFPALDLPAWRRFARLALGHRRGKMGGILVARRAGRRHISGLICYRREPDLVLGQVLRARDLIAIDIVDTGSIVLALISGLRSHARACGCSSVHLMMPDMGFSATLLPGLISHLGGCAAFNRWVDVSVPADEVLLGRPCDLVH